MRIGGEKQLEEGLNAYLNAYSFIFYAVKRNLGQTRKVRNLGFKCIVFLQIL